MAFLSQTTETNQTHRFNYEEVMRFIEDLKGKGEL